MGVCYRCGSTGSIDIPQIEGIGGRTIDSFDPYRDSDSNMRYVDEPEYDFDRWENGRPDPIAPQSNPPEDPINDDDIPF